MNGRDRRDQRTRGKRDQASANTASGESLCHPKRAESGECPLSRRADPCGLPMARRAISDKCSSEVRISLTWPAVWHETAVVAVEILAGFIRRRVSAARAQHGAVVTIEPARTADRGRGLGEMEKSSKCIHGVVAFRVIVAKVAGNVVRFHVTDYIIIYRYMHGLLSHYRYDCIWMGAC